MNIKICGLTRPEDMVAVNQALPDYAGFVFAPGKRLISPQTAGMLKALLSPRIPAVGVFVHASIRDIVALGESKTIDLIQLHGGEPESYINTLKQHTDLPIIKAVRVTSTEQILEAQDTEANYLLLDTYVKGVYGGSGQCFDWSLIPKLSKPFFLAGGLTMDHLGAALATQAFCLDVSSSVETDGKKDPRKISRMVLEVKKYETYEPGTLDITESGNTLQPQNKLT